MARRRTRLACHIGLGIALAAASCTHLPSGSRSALRCGVLGGSMGGIAGGVLANSQALVGSGIGAAVGAALGSSLCAGARSELPLQVRIRTSAQSGEAPLEVGLVAEVGPAGRPSIGRYDWDLGDGSRTEGLAAAHTYARAGEYTATLTITTAGSVQATARTQITVRTSLSPRSALRDFSGIAKRHIVVPGTNFDFDSTEVVQGDIMVLMLAADELKAEPGLRARVVGHTDSKGTSQYNQRLSERRAQAVVRFLIEHGVPADRLRAVGRGESQPLATNDTDDGRAANRRVELELLERSTPDPKGPGDPARQPSGRDAVLVPGSWRKRLRQSGLPRS